MQNVLTIHGKSFVHKNVHMGAIFEIHLLKEISVVFKCFF